MPEDIPGDREFADGFRDWPHAPPHRLAEAGVYFLTVRCREQALYFHSDERRDYLLERLQTLAAKYGWTLEAWAVLSNHYHFVAQSPTVVNLSKFTRHLHGDTARFVNGLDERQGRAIWQNYREKHITLPRA